MRTEQLPPQSPFNLICFIIHEFHNVQRLADIYAKLPEKNFLDASSVPEVIQQWKMLGLTCLDKTHMLKFNVGNGWGEMELIFRDNKLVQAGIQMFSDSSNKFPIQQLFKAVEEIVGLGFHIEIISSAHIMFSNNIVNGYVHALSDLSLVFRVAELKWCESVYGPSFSKLV